MGGRKELHMNTEIRTMTLLLSAALSLPAGELATTTLATTSLASTTEDVVARMVERDHVRQAQMGEYSVMCRYKLENKSRHAEMLVHWTRQADGVKRYEIISESGDGGVRGHVFHKLLDAEVDASKPAQRERTHMSPENYDFRLVGVETVK